MSKKYYIGLTSTFHDPAMTILYDDGSVLFAEAAERYFQVKRAVGCPADPITRTQKIIEQYCSPDAEFHIATCWSKKFTATLGFLNLLGILKYPAGRSSKLVFNKLIRSQTSNHNLVWMLKKMLASNIQTGSTVEKSLRANFGVDKIVHHKFSHHLCHAASGVYASGYDDALCLVVDGMGEKGSISFFDFENNSIKTKGTHIGQESLGLFYIFLTSLCGFDPLQGEEWKVMGLASYGELDKTYYDLLDDILYVQGTEIKFKSTRAKMQAIEKTIQEDIRSAENNFIKKANLAYTGQFLYSQYTTKLINNLEGLSRSKNLVFAGGCALNSSFNGTILNNSNFKSLYIPPAPGDDGASLGAAYLAFNKQHPGVKPLKQILSPYLGSSIPDSDIENFIRFSAYTKIKHYPDTIHIETARLLAEGKLIGWAQGKAEFGPRSLGNRAILADPRSVQMKETINCRVKFREEFRPFAPSILSQYGDEYFENYQESPYMERTLRFKKEVVDKVPAVVHVDGTGRLQSVKKEWNEKYYLLLNSFHDITGIPVLLNTSFNVMGKPIIHSFNDALNVFFNSGLDAIAVNDYILYK